MKRDPGLQIGIIGGGKLGRQLAESLLEFSKVYPEELQISTRQPDTLCNFIF
jgi:pyrroline-5-carboxylate reductase